MISVIKDFYKKAGVVPFLLKSKLARLEKHPDILAEFVQWIENGTYQGENGVAVYGFSAKALAEKSPLLDGEGAFMTLIELRENPEKAKEMIERHLVIK